MAAEKDDVLVFNHHQADLKVSDRVNAKGAVTGQRTFVVTTMSEPITVMLDEGEVARRAAQMLAQRIREQTEHIVERVDESTEKARRNVERAFYKAKPWAWRKFDGGRTGVTPPRAGENRKYNHSGRLAQSIVAAFVKSTKEWRINFAANRWNPRDWRSLGDMQRAFQGWVNRVPVLKDASADLGIQQAIRETFSEVMQKAEMAANARYEQLKRQAKLEAIKLAETVLAA
jgi:hypothetical protein